MEERDVRSEHIEGMFHYALRKELNYELTQEEVIDDSVYKYVARKNGLAHVMTDWMRDEYKLFCKIFFESLNVSEEKAFMCRSHPQSTVNAIFMGIGSSQKTYVALIVGEDDIVPEKWMEEFY
jgi:hypothetical protein